MIGNTSKTDQRVLNAQHEQWENYICFYAEDARCGAELPRPVLWQSFEGETPSDAVRRSVRASCACMR